MRTAICLALLVLPAVAKEAPVVVMPKTGEFWYRMEDPAGKPQGYARLVLGEREGGGLAVGWELKLAGPGWSYEEERGMTLDAEWRLLDAAYSTGETEVREERKDGKMAGRELPDDAATGMIFVFAAMLPQEEGTVFGRTGVNESEEFKIEGAYVFVFAGKDEDGLAKFEMRKPGGNVLPVWVNADREIVKVDWGGGNLMRLSAESTRELFKPEPPAVTERETPKDRLVVEGDFPKLSPEEFYDHFAKAELLTTFWPPKAEVEAKPGGKFLLTWPDAGWKLLGKVIEAERGKRFAFTWKWAHQPEDAPELTVTIELAPLEGGGTRMVLTHRPYDPESESDMKERAGHLDGWKYVFAKLTAK